MVKVIAIACFFLTTSSAFSQQKKSNTPSEMEVVICADLSASTNGLIYDLKENFWHLINHHATLKPKSNLRISYIFFGRPSFGSKNSYVKIAVPLSQSYDSIYSVIDGVKPNIEKGDQYVTSALDQAINHSQWSKHKSALKIIFLIGNGNIMPSPELEQLCNQASENNITINTIYCHSYLIDKELKNWEKLAYFGNGKSAVIRINKNMPSDGILHSKTLFKLNDGLNNTCVYFGENGFNNFKLMHDIDSGSYYGNQTNFGGRLIYKISRINTYLTWDITSLSASSTFDLYSIEQSTLPPAFANTSADEMKAILAHNREQRSAIIDQIKEMLKSDLEKLQTNYIVKEDVGEEENLNRVIIKQFLKKAVSQGCYW
jgi:hypothetical protein